MMNLPSISILIPVYNVEKYIADCTKSVMAQTYTGKMECIIVDDCSTDNSITIAEQLIGDYNGSIKFRIVHHEHNRGLAAARNTAVSAAKGDFIIHVDSDDWIEPTMVEELVKKQQETNADIVSCNAIAHYVSGTSVWKEKYYASKRDMIMSLIQISFDHVIWRRLIRTSLYKINHIEAVEGINIGEDHYTMPRLLYYAKSFAKCDKILYHYNCMNSNSYMQSANNSFNYNQYKSNVASLGILIKFFDEVNDRIYLEELYKIKAQYVYSNFFATLKVGNKEAYCKLCDDWDSVNLSYRKCVRGKIYGMALLSASNYYINRLRVYIRIFIKKIIGIRNYEL